MTRTTRGLKNIKVRPQSAPVYQNRSTLVRGGSFKEIELSRLCNCLHLVCTQLWYVIFSITCMFSWNNPVPCKMFTLQTFPDHFFELWALVLFINHALLSSCFLCHANTFCTFYVLLAGGWNEEKWRKNRVSGDSISGGIFKQSIGARNWVGIGLSYRPARLNSFLGIDSWVP